MYALQTCFPFTSLMHVSGTQLISQLYLCQLCKLVNACGNDENTAILFPLFYFLYFILLLIFHRTWQLIQHNFFLDEFFLVFILKCPKERFYLQVCNKIMFIVYIAYIVSCLCISNTKSGKRKVMLLFVYELVDSFGNFEIVRLFRSWFSL